MQVKNAILVTLNISSWDANRQDKRVSKDVADANEVKDQRLCRLRKSLLPKTEVMDKLLATVRAARTFHYDNTHAWMHDGPRMLLTSNFDAYMLQMRTFKADFESCVLNFLGQYDAIRDEATGVLGKLYDAADYPDKGTLKSRYGFEIKAQPMPATTELLELGLEPAEADALRSKLEADMAETFARANRRNFEDLQDRLSKLVTKLADEKAYVKEETIAGVRDLAELLPRMNILNDDRLDMLAERLKSSLEGVSAEAVKNNPDTRARVAAETQTVFNVMQAFMNPASMAASATDAVAELKRAA